MSGKFFAMITLSCLVSILVYLVVLPFLAAIVMLIWNLLVEYLKYGPHIAYLQSLKLCFYITLLRMLWGISAHLSYNKTKG